MTAEDYGLVLDFLARGKSSSFKTEPIAQLIGLEHFTLLEVVPKPDVEMKALEKVYVGKDDRQKIDHIKRRIAFKDLTTNSLAEIEKAIEKIIKENEKSFLDFYNSCHPITIKRHQLELLPGLGKKHMHGILEERNIKPFESFEDLSKRVKLLPDPMKALMKRVMEELEGIDIKYYLFVRPPAKPKPFFASQKNPWEKRGHF